MEEKLEVEEPWLMESTERVGDSAGTWREGGAGDKRDVGMVRPVGERQAPGTSGSVALETYRLTSEGLDLPSEGGR